MTCYIDDILVSSPDEETHIQILEGVFNSLDKHAFRLKQEKCEFLLSNIEYLGHIVDEAGLHPLPSKVEAITKAPIPVNAQQLRLFLGLVNYYGKFIPNLATHLHSLNQLLQAHKKWKWSRECAKPFREVKN